MTISSDSVKNSYAGNGTTKDFAITFTYFDNSEIQVYLKTDSTGAEVLKALTTHYTISGSPGSSPLVSMGTAPASGETLLIKRNTPFTQLTDYTAGDAFPADSHEAALDKLAALCQQLKETLSRSWTFPHSYSTLSDVKMPIPAANGIIKWNADATALVMDTSLALSGYKLQATTSEDTTPGFLNDKLTAGTGLSKTQTTGEVNQQVTLNVDAAQTQITSVGALDGGSITSGFGTIDTGSSNITTTGTVSAGLIAGAAVKDEDNMASDSATHLATQQSIKAYVDSSTAAINDDATTSNKGVASFNSDSFSVSSGHVSVKTSAILDAPVLKATDASNAGKILFKEGTDNGTNSVTLAGPAATADVTVTLPASTDTLVGKATTDTLTNKTITTPTIAGPTLSATSTTVGGKILFKEGTDNGTNAVTLQGPASTADVTVTLPAATDTLVGKATTDTLTNKTFDLGGTGNSLTGSLAEFNTALQSDSFCSLTGSESLTNKTLTSPVLNTGVSGTAVKDEDDMTSDSATHLATQQSIKAYVDANAGGGGAGSIDTLFTMQAKSESAAYTARGNAYVWSGDTGGSLTNATLALETTAADLIQSDKVFAYDAGGDSSENWWYHEKVIQPGYGGKNMVLQLQYYTRNGADGESFRFYARNASKPIFTSSGSADGSNTVAGVVTWDASLPAGEKQAAAVGDRVVLFDTSNAIHYRYITAVSATTTTGSASLTITYSGADIAAANSKIMLVGVMSDELDYLPANDVTANEAKVYRKQMAFDAGCTLFQFGFLCTDTDTDIELYYDDIALSANQFLQTSSQGQSEEYRAHTRGDSDGIPSDSSYNKMVFFATEVKNSIDKVGTVANNGTYGFSFTANQKCKITLDAMLAFTSSSWFGISKNSTELSTNVSAITVSDRMSIHAADGGGQTQSASWTGIMEKGDVVRIHTNGATLDSATSQASVYLTATPQVNDVVLLNSQDEIFTDWVEYTPGNLGSGSNWNVSTNVKFSWRRIGGDMEIRGFFTIASGGATAYNAYVGLPSGYTIDQGNLNGTSKRDFVGSWVCPTSGTVDYYGGTNGIAGVFFTTTTDSSNIYFSRQGSSATELGLMSANSISASNSVSLTAKVPIAGWTSTFNPVLSMPLVDIGRDSESLILQDPIISTSATQRVHYGTVLDSTDYSGDLFTYDNDDEDGLKITFNQNVDASVDFGAYATSSQWMAIAKNVDAGTTGAYSLTNTDVIAFGNTGSVNLSTVPFSGKFQAGDYLFFHCNVNTTGADGNKVTFSIKATKDRGNTNMAHIIKPAVCIVKNVQAYNTMGGSAQLSGSTWYSIPLNTIEGESWFLSLNTSNYQVTLEAGQYSYTASAPFYDTDRSQLMLYNETDSVVLSPGIPTYTTSFEGVGFNTLRLEHTFTVTKSTAICLKYLVTTAQASNGLGYPHNVDSGVNNVYGLVKIEKLK